MLYFAYGSNLNRAHFEALCPAARPLGRAVLDNYRLVFRRFADIDQAEGARVEGGLWRITPACEAALDIYEEVARGLYRRVTLTVRAGDGERMEALSYRMIRTGFEPPLAAYAATIAAGYADFGIDPEGLALAVASAEAQETPGLYATRPDA